MIGCQVCWWVSKIVCNKSEKRKKSECRRDVKQLVLRGSPHPLLYWVVVYAPTISIIVRVDSNVITFFRSPLHLYSSLNSLPWLDSWSLLMLCPPLAHFNFLYQVKGIPQCTAKRPSTILLFIPFILMHFKPFSLFN